MNNTVNTCTTV